MPLPLIITIIIVSFFIKSISLKKKLRTGAIVALLIVSNPYIANQLMKSWEGSPTPLSLVEHHDIGIVLTGVTNRHKYPKDRVYFQHGADRIFHALQLYRLKKIDKILISGGSGKLQNTENDNKEADDLALILKLANVPDSVIIIENESRNTSESARYTSQLLKDYPNHSLMLITSGFHMRRASLCFEKQDMEVTPFRTDFYSQDEGNIPDDYLTPKPTAIHQWNKVIREITGIIVYKMMGYI